VDLRGGARLVSLPRRAARIYTRAMAVLDARPASARDALRRQIADLERFLAGDVLAGVPMRMPVPPSASERAPADGPRVLTPAELESLRDRLADLLGGRPCAEARARLERMRADPAAHRGERVTQLELGEIGCGTWVVRPRLGPLGRLMGWWRVKLSSGCPLAAAAQAARAA
jgi:hypothetical protein